LDNTLIMFCSDNGCSAEHPDIVKQLAAEWQTCADRVAALRHRQPR
jgi:hypothetical protein